MPSLVLCAVVGRIYLRRFVSRVESGLRTAVCFGIESGERRKSFFSFPILLPDPASRPHSTPREEESSIDSQERPSLASSLDSSPLRPLAPSRLSKLVAADFFYSTRAHALSRAPRVRTVSVGKVGIAIARVNTSSVGMPTYVAHALFSNLWGKPKRVRAQRLQRSTFRHCSKSLQRICARLAEYWRMAIILVARWIRHRLARAELNTMKVGERKLSFVIHPCVRSSQPRRPLAATVVEKTFSDDLSALNTGGFPV